MTEPGTGSDLQGIATTAVKDGDHYVLNGSKTFITNGINADFVIVACKTDPAAGAMGVSLVVVERGMEGFERGRNLDKMGLKAQDTAELFFDNVRVPAGNLLGEEGKGFIYLMEKLPQERLTISVVAAAACRNVIDMTLEYVKDRRAFGKPIGSFQNSRFVLAELETEQQIAQVFVDRSIMELNAKNLSVSDAAMGKWWTTELQKKTVDKCLQLFGGYGYMAEYPISKAYTDTRIQTIYGGTTEIMKEIIGRTMGL
jgi:alkylation response protein AidB-like acyl-CoA dehydrogenase